MLRAVLGRSGILWDGSFHPLGSAGQLGRAVLEFGFYLHSLLGSRGAQRLPDALNRRLQPLKLLKAWGLLSPLQSASGL